MISNLIPNLSDMPDDLDRAAAISQAECEDGIAAARRALVGCTYSHCADCGEAIPEARRLLGNVKRCIDCAQLYEFHRKQHGK
jgi:RNA polymerase-binding transcription factor DksA